MPKFPSARETWIDALVSRKFPTRRTDYGAVHNPFGGIPADDKAMRERYAASEKYKTELSQLSDEELCTRFEACEAEIESQRWFNQQSANADMDLWARKSYWTLDEAVALSLGKNPKLVNFKKLASLGRSPFAKEYFERNELVTRAKEMGQLWEKTIPSVFVAWAERMRFSMSAELVEAVKALGIQIANWKALFEQQKELTEQAQGQVNEERAAHMAALQEHSDAILKMKAERDKLVDGYKELLRKKDSLIAATDEQIKQLATRVAELEAVPAASAEKSLGVKERDSLLKLVIAMAMDGYGYDPKAARSPIAKELANHLAVVGLSLDEDTVRKYLAEGKELLPGDEIEQKG